MNYQMAAKYLDKVFYVILLAILLLNSLMYLFAFTINWEAYFFGMKIDGMNAGIILFMYFFISTVLAYLLFMFRQRIVIIAFLSVIFFGFKFIESAETIQELSNGLSSYNGFMAIFMITPLFVLVGHLIVARFYNTREDPAENGEKNKSVL